MILKLGIIGTGKIGQQHIRRCKNVLKNVRVVAVSDVNVEVARETLDNLNIKANVYQDGYEIINSSKVDAILITSWDTTHEEFTLAAIKAKKPVFCEKPLSLDANGCRRIIDAELKYGKRLVQVGFMRSYDSSYRALKNSLINGEIGKPLMLHCAHRNQYVDENYTTDMTITNTLIHELDILRWLTEDDYKSVQVIFPRSTSKSHAKLRDPQIILLETQKGIRINVEIFVNCTYGYDIQCEIIGEDGTIKLSDPSSIQTRKNTCLYKKLFATWQERFIHAYDIELQTFINDIKDNGLTGPSAWDGFVASIAADVCLKAQKSGNIEPIVIPVCPLFYNS